MIPLPRGQLCRLTDPVSRLGIQHLLLLEVLGHKLDVVTVHDERQGRELIEGLTVEPSHVCRALGQAVLPGEGGRAWVVVQPLPGFDTDMLCYPEGGRPPVEIPVLHILMLLVKPVPRALQEDTLHDSGCALIHSELPWLQGGPGGFVFDPQRVSFLNLDHAGS